MRKNEHGAIISKKTLIVAQEDATEAQEQVAIRLNKQTGVFSIELPDHIADVQHALYEEEDHPDWLYTGVIRTTSMVDVVRHFKTICLLYIRWYRTRNETKHIGVTLQYNLRHIADFHEPRNSTEFAGYNGGRRQEISFAGNPALHLQYQILYKVGDDYFTKHRDGRLQQRRFATGEVQIIEWTEERETILSEGIEALEKLIMRLIEFMDHPAENIDRLATAGAGLLLAAPQPTEDRQ